MAKTGNRTRRHTKKLMANMAKQALVTLFISMYLTVLAPYRNTSLMSWSMRIRSPTRWYLHA